MALAPPFVFWLPSVRATVQVIVQGARDPDLDLGTTVEGRTHILRGRCAQISSTAAVRRDG